MIRGDGWSGGRHRVAALVATAVAILAGAAFTAVAQAGDVKLTAPLTQRTAGDATVSYTGTEYAYVGPEITGAGKSGPGEVGPHGTSVDTYYCPSGQKNTGRVVVGDTKIDHWRGAWTAISGEIQTESFTERVTSWSRYTQYYRVAASCTDQLRLFPVFHTNECGLRANCFQLGDFWDFWDAQLPQGEFASAANYTALSPKVFCWEADFKGCGSLSKPAGTGVRARAAAVRARPAGNRFTLKNGTNRISLTFRHPARTRRPPAIRMFGASGCRSKRMHTSVHDGAGRIELYLACQGLRSGGAVRLRIGPAIARHFRLRRGTGRLRISLDKPPGPVEPYVHVSYGRAGTPCRSVDQGLRVLPRSFNMRITARCGSVARDAVGHLYLGGLLAAER